MVLVVESLTESPMKQYSIQRIKRCFCQKNNLIPLTRGQGILHT